MGHRQKMLNISLELIRSYICRKLFYNKKKRIQAKGPTPIRTAAKDITVLLRKLSELASCTT